MSSVNAKCLCQFRPKKKIIRTLVSLHSLIKNDVQQSFLLLAALLPWRGSPYMAANGYMAMLYLRSPVCGAPFTTTSTAPGTTRSRFGTGRRPQLKPCEKGSEEVHQTTQIVCVCAPWALANKLFWLYSTWYGAYVLISDRYANITNPPTC